MTAPRICFVQDSDLDYVGPEDDFCPSERWPEYPFSRLATRPNPIYAAVRRLLADAGLDAERLGAPEWNPLGEYVRPGSRIFVLCNFVYHRRPNETEEGFFAKCIHASVLRPILDYLLIAAGPEGRISFGNAPLQSCEWDKVLADTHANRLPDFYAREQRSVKAVDLRLVVAPRDALGRVTEVAVRDGARSAVEIDLAEESLLSEQPGPQPLRYRVADYDPDHTEAYHRNGSHCYVVHRDVLDSDVIVSLSKLKTHEKVGITCGLKGFVGTIGHKDCLAHSRFGSPTVDGDQYPTSMRFLRPVSAFQDWVYRRPQDAPMQNAVYVVDRNVKRVLRRLGMHQDGAWHGNDTAWRMALDIGRIVYYADRAGMMTDEVQRTHISFIDGVIGGEGNGPLAPSPVESGILLFSDDVAAGDRVAAQLMGFSPDRIPIVREALTQRRYPLYTKAEPIEVRSNGETISESELHRMTDRRFASPSGWGRSMNAGV